VGVPADGRAVRREGRRTDRAGLTLVSSPFRIVSLE
jgi:hypothetical protein